MVDHLRVLTGEGVRILRVLLCVLGFVLAASVLIAQQDAPPPPVPIMEGPLPLPVPLPPSEQTPPILPPVVETPLPPLVEAPPPQWPADVPNRPLTANEAVLIALHHQSSLLAARAGVMSAQGVQQQARSALGPSLTVDGAYNRNLLGTTSINNGGIIGTGNTGVGTGFSGVSLSANLRQLLFDFNHTREAVRQAESLTQSARANLTRTQSDLVLQVKQNFYQYMQNLWLVRVNEDNVRNSQAHLAMARARVEAGTGLPIDLVRAATAVADAILNLTVARNTAVTSRVTLAQLLGIDPRTPIQPADSAEPTIDMSNMTALTTLALQRRPDIMQAQSAIRAAQYGVSAAKSSNAPALVGSLGWTQRGSGLSLNNRSVNLGVAVQWTPFNSGLTKGLVTEAQANALTAQAQLSSVQEQIVADVTQAYLNVITAQQRVVTANAEISNAQESLKLAQGRYQAGVGIFLDILDAQNALTVASINRINALSALNQARAALAHAVFLDIMAQPR
ncbi:MAG TPA: TolC family protein [Armatimonadota bacterium]